MPNYNGVWSITTQYQNASDWPKAPEIILHAGSLGALGATNQIQRFNAVTAANSVDFGDLTTSRHDRAGFGSNTRAIFAGGTSNNVIEFVTFVTDGNATDFGDLSATNIIGGGASNNTRGLIAGTDDPGDTIEYVTIASASNSTDFGNLSVARYYNGGLASTTRAVWGGGQAAGGGHPVNNTMDYVTIGSTGNAVDFGDLSAARRTNAGASSATRGIFGGGYSNTSTTAVNIIEYITIASTSNTTDFGDLTVARGALGAGAGSTRAMFAGGRTSSGVSNVIDFVEIATTANATDFADLSESSERGPCIGASAAAVQP